MKKVISIAIVCSVCVMLLSSCGREEEYQPENIQVGITYYNENDTFLGELIDLTKSYLEELDNGKGKITVMVRDADGSQKTQNDQVEELIGSGCNVLCVNLVDRADPSEIIDLAKDHDIPIIFFNREPVAEDMMQWEKLYCVGADAKQSGVMQGEIAIDVIHNSRVDRNKDGKIQYVVLEGELGHQDAFIRTENAVNTIKESGIQMEKMSYQIANWSRAQAQNRMMQLIGQYQSQIELVLANNDDMALGAADAYREMNYTEANWPVFLGIDGTNVGLEAVRDSVLSGTVYNNKEGQAEAISALCIATVTGEGMKDISFENGKYIYLPYFKVTRDNVKEYLEEKY